MQAADTNLSLGNMIRGVSHTALIDAGNCQSAQGVRLEQVVEREGIGEQEQDHGRCQVGRAIRMRYDLGTMRRTRLLRLPIGL
jgi:hypothetical protein